LFRFFFFSFSSLSMWAIAFTPTKFFVYSFT
jgi:hypothetical protein